MKFPTLAGLLFAFALVGCTTEGDDDDSTPTSTTVEFADIFIPERIIEIPVLPAGTEVVTEVPIHNAGDQELKIEDIELNYDSDSNFSLNEDTVPPVIRPHDVAVIEVVYVAADEADTFAALDIFSDDPDEAEKTVAFIGRQATGGPHARVSANTLDWGFQFRGQEVHKLVEIHNDGDEPLRITDITLNQSVQQVAFHQICPGQQLADCDWETEIKPNILNDEILPGSAALLELAFVPLTLQSSSAELRIATSDPVRPSFSVFLIGNGDSALNCTPPTITVTSPTEAAFFHEWEDLVVSARVFDQEQPAGTLLVEMFLGDVFIENAFPDENGRVTFTIDIDDHEPALPSGLQPFVLRVTDGCPTFGFATFVAAIDFPLSSTDLDGDGFDGNQGDCDDGDASAFPQNIEVFDGIDNDCDGTVDEGTQVWDDDCDGYCEHDSICLGQAEEVVGGTCDGLASEPYNDCNDSPFDLDQNDEADGTAIHPDAEELQTFIDDNCNGVVDEGTSLFDDDGDGQTEVGFDCNDDDPQIFQGATEWCDDADNDCDGDIDEFCVDQTAPPRIIGGVITDKFQIGFGGRTRAQVLVVSSDDNLSFQWFADMNASYDEPATGPVVFWNAPEDTDENRAQFNGAFPSLWVEVTDSLGQKDIGFGQVLISTDVVTTFSPIQPNSGSGDCSLVGGAGSGLLLLPLLGAVRRRRR